MFSKAIFPFVLTLNLLAVITATTIYRHTGVNHFKEGSFLTTLSCLQLLVISGIVFQIKKHSLWKNSSVVWIFIALCFLFLAADEFFEIHETIDHIIHYIFNIQETALTDRIDDVLVGLYGLAGASVLIFFRQELMPYKRSAPLFISGFLLLFAMVIIDVITNRPDILPLLLDAHQAAPLHTFLSLSEEALKIFAESFFLLAFYTILQISKLNRPVELAQRRKQSD